MTKKTETQAVTHLAAALTQALADPSVQGDADLRKLLTKNAQRLTSDQTNYHQVAADLNQGLRYWGMAHLSGSKVLNDLYQATIDGIRGRAYQRQPTGFND